MGLHSGAELARRFVETMQLLNVYLNHFPKHEKYALCGLIRSTAYELFDLITEGQKRYHKKTSERFQKASTLSAIGHGGQSVLYANTVCTGFAKLSLKTIRRQSYHCSAMRGARRRCVGC